MKAFFLEHKLWIFPILFLILPSAFLLPSVISQVLYLLILLFFIWKKRISEFLILYLFLLMLSDSRQQVFYFSQEIKPIATLFLPILLLIVRREVIVKHDFFKNMLPYFAVAVFMLIFAFDIANAIQKTLSYFIVFSCLPLLVKIEYQKDGKFLKSFLYFFLIYLVIGIVLKYVSPSFVMLEREERFTGLMGNPNGLGILLVVVFSFFQAMRQAFPEVMTKWVKITFYVTLVLSLFWCGSRSAMMSVVLFYGFAFIYSLSSFIGWIAFGVSMFFYEFILTLIPIVTNYLGFGESLRVESVDKIKEGSGRTIAWQFAWAEIQKDYIFGKGIGYTELFFKKNYWLLAWKGHQGNAHNTYLTMWLDTGVLGVLSFFTGWITTFIQAGKKYSYAVPILFSILFSINYESWLSGSLNPFTPITLIALTVFFLRANEEDEVQEAEVIESDVPSDAVEVMA